MSGFSNKLDSVHQNDEGAYQISESLKEVVEVGLDNFTQFGKYQLRYRGTRTKDNFVVDRSFVDGKKDGPTVLIFGIEEFVIRGGQGATIDLSKLMPEGGEFLTGELSNPEYRAPEIHKQMIALNEFRVGVDDDYPMVVIGNLDADEAQNAILEYGYDPEYVVEDLTWNILFANFYEKLGLPGDKDAIDAVRTKIIASRTRLLNLLDQGNGDVTNQAMKIASFEN